MRLSGKRTILTGGAGGIGQGALRAFVKEGAKVAVLDIRDERGQAAVEAVNQSGNGIATYYHCDVGDAEQVNAVFETAIAGLDGLDVLVHAAAKNTMSKPAEEYTVDDMQFYWSNNINGTILTNQAAYRQFVKENQGAIINFASDEGLTGTTVTGLYAASKGAVVNWTKSIAMTWARAANVRCNSVCPTIKTDLFQAYLDRMSPEDRDKFLSVESTRTPLGGSMGDADKDLAPVLVFLASDDARYLNGQIICVNGGRNMLRG
jgi:NAD(P)-dependent dehydrogenase (short-subunit alcohol dehydrogenase family)